MAKYEVTIKESKGTCDTALFKKMAKNGDITAVSIKEIINKVVNITGYASCHISWQCLYIVPHALCNS